MSEWIRRGSPRSPGIDKVLALATVALLVIGTLLVWSATSHEVDPYAYLKRHLVNVAIGLLLSAAVMATDHRYLRLLAPAVYGVSLIGLMLVLVMGSTINGSRSWLRFAGMSVQPAEFAKFAVVMMLALAVAERVERARPRRTVSDVAVLLGLAGAPAALILLQPDLGTMLVLAATVVGVLAVSGLPGRWLGGLVGAGVVGVVGVVAAGVLKPYQIDRFLAFIDPALDPRGAGYNTIQARIAIGNGGIFGQGHFHGSQTRAGFVPEQQTDFVFTVAGEELGLLGAGVVVLLLGLVIWRATLISLQASDLFGRVAAAGIACWLGFQAFQNIGMCLGIMPVTGVPLPLLSYGGSSMFATLMAIGLLHNIAMRGTVIPLSLLPRPREFNARVG